MSIKDKFRKLFAPKPLPKPAPETEEQRLSREKADLEQAAEKAKEYEEKTGVKICRAFFIEDYLLRSVHLRNVERIEDYGSMLNGRPLYDRDDGGRYLGRCRECGALLLVQDSELHSYSDSDAYFTDYVPVSSREEAMEINEKYDGFQLVRQSELMRITTN